MMHKIHFVIPTCFHVENCPHMQCTKCAHCGEGVLKINVFKMKPTLKMVPFFGNYALCWCLLSTVSSSKKFHMSLTGTIHNGQPCYIYNKNIVVFVKYIDDRSASIKYTSFQR